MRTKKSVKYFTHLPVLIGLSFCWISCNQSSVGEATATTTATDTSIIGTLEMKPPGSIISKEEANKWVEEYRRGPQGGPFSTKTIIHHPDAVKFYMDSIFNKYTPKVALPDSHIWRIAFTPMIKLGQPGGPKFSICLLPCIVDTGSSKKVYEFFDAMQGNTDYYRNYYLKLYNMIPSFALNKMKNDSIPDGFIFDEGQLWP